LTIKQKYDIYQSDAILNFLTYKNYGLLIRTSEQLITKYVIIIKT